MDDEMHQAVSRLSGDRIAGVDHRQMAVDTGRRHRTSETRPSQAAAWMMEITPIGGDAALGGLERDMIEKGVIKEMGEVLNAVSAGILMGHPATPADLAGICTFLASADSDYMTGQIIMCDGGMVLA
jgi:NAD(P)-dependent dehydrogenase (short-subunit alcohol dehydrogenase family)